MATANLIVNEISPDGLTYQLIGTFSGIATQPIATALASIRCGFTTALAEAATISGSWIIGAYSGIVTGTPTINPPDPFFQATTNGNLKNQSGLNFNIAWNFSAPVTLAGKQLNLIRLNQAFGVTTDFAITGQAIVTTPSSPGTLTASVNLQGDTLTLNGTWGGDEVDPSITFPGGWDMSRCRIVNSPQLLPASGYDLAVTSVTMNGTPVYTKGSKSITLTSQLNMTQTPAAAFVSERLTNGDTYTIVLKHTTPGALNVLVGTNIDQVDFNYNNVAGISAVSQADNTFGFATVTGGGPPTGRANTQTDNIINTALLANTANIASNTAAIAVNTGNIGTNTSAIGTLTSTVNNLNLNALTDVTITAVTEADSLRYRGSQWVNEKKPRGQLSYPSLNALPENGGANIASLASVKLNAATYLSSNLVDFGTTVNGRLQYVGTRTFTALVNICGSFNTGDNNRAFRIQLRSNAGTVEVPLSRCVAISRNNPQGADDWSKTFLLSIANGDNFEIWATNIHGSATALTMSEVNMVIVAID